MISATVPQALRACVVQWQICRILKKGVEDSLLLKGNRSKEPFPRVTLFELFCRFFFTPPSLCAFAPKHSQNGHPKNVKNLKNRKIIAHLF